MLDNKDVLSQRALGTAVLDEFPAADVIVLGVAFYDSGIAGQLKARIDHIAVPAKTFHYTQLGDGGRLAASALS